MRCARAGADAGARSVARRYVREEINVRELVGCDEPARFATLRGEPNWAALGKRLGKAMGAVSAAVLAR